MKAAVLHAPYDLRVEELPHPKIAQRTDAIIRIAATCVCGSDLWPYRGFQPINGPDADGARILRLRRGGRPRGEVGQAGAVRHRLVRHVRQHLPQLPVRLPVVVRAPRVHDPGAGAAAPRAAGGRDAGADAGRAVGRPGPEPADDVGRAGHRLVRRRRGQREAGVDRRGRRRRRGRPARRALGEADGGRADHRDEPARDSGRSSPASSARPTSSPSAATRAWRASRR